MQSEDLDLKLVRDTQLANIKKSLSYAVKQGPSSVDWQSYESVSKTSSSITWAIQPPSENSAVSRVFLTETDYNFKLTFTGVAGQLDNVRPFVWGVNCSTQAFPFNQNIINANLNINGAANSCSVQDILPQLLRMFDPHELQQFNGMCPCLVDKYQKYVDTSDDVINSHPLSGLKFSGHNVFLEPRGTLPISPYVSAPATALYVLTGEGAHADATTGTGGDATTVVTASFSLKIIEPLFISPLLFKAFPNNDQAIIGVNSINLNLNTDASFSRFFSVAIASDKVYTPAVSSVTIINSKLHLNYMSLQPGHSIETRNIVPFMDYTRQIQTQTALGTGSRTITSNAYQLSIIPDKIVIVVRPTTRTMDIADYYLPITQINVTFGTQSGLLSNATQFQLYKMSCDAGLKAMNWYEWSGSIYKQSVSNAVMAAGTDKINTVGSILVIDPTMLNLPEYLAPGSQGQFNMSFKLTVNNNTGGALDATLVTIFCNSGAYVTQSGRSAFYLGLLDKSSVVALNEAQGQDPMSKAQLERQIGGAGLSDSVAMGLAPMARMGSARSNGGSRSGGKRSKLDEFLA